MTGTVSDQRTVSTSLQSVGPQKMDQWRVIVTIDTEEREKEECRIKE